jgi:hypothetical protein
VKDDLDGIAREFDLLEAVTELVAAIPLRIVGMV